MKIGVNVLVIIILAAIPLMSFAPPGGSWNPGDTDPTVPLSGGIIFLIASAVVYAVKKYISSRKKF